MTSMFSKAHKWLRSLTEFMVMGDYVTIILMLCLALFSFTFTPWILKNRTGEIEIKSGTRTVGMFSLKNQALVNVRGKIGETRVQIKDGKASIIDSPCANKYCQHMGHVGDSGGVLVCVPNEIIVCGVNESHDGLDAVSK